MSVLDGYSISELAAPHAWGRILSSPDHELWTFDPTGIIVRDKAGWHSYADRGVVNFARRSSMLQMPWFTYSVFHGSEDRMDIVPADSGVAVLMFPECLIEWNRITGSRHVLRHAGQTRLTRFRGLQPARNGGMWVIGETGVARLQNIGSGDIGTRDIGNGKQWLETPGPAGYREFTYPIEADNEELFVSSIRSDGRRAVLRMQAGIWKEVYVADASVTRLRGWRGPGGHIWIQSGRKILRLDSNGSAPQINYGKEIAGLTTAVLIQPDRSFWLATTAGVARYAPPIWRTPEDVAWADQAVSAITGDAQGRVWFVAGGFLISEENGKWQRFRIPMGASDSLLTDNLVALANGDLAVLANSLPNVVIFHPRSHQFDVVPNSDGKRIGWIAPRREGGLWVQRLASDGNHWTLDIFENGKFRSAGFPAMTVFKELKAILETSSGDLWLASTNAAGQIHDGELKTFGSKDGFLDSGVFSLLETPESHVLLGGRDHLTEFDGRTFRNLGDIDVAESIAIDAHGVIWVASGSGVHRYKPGQWITNTVDDGLPANAVRKVFADSHGRIWVGTGQGISLYYPLADSDPPITRIVDDRNFRQTPPDGKVRLTFSGMDKWKFTPPDRLLFSWRMDNSGWSEFTGTDFAAFEDLKGGQHQFAVRSMDRNGNIDPNPAIYEFSVLLPWYKQTEFLLLAALAVFVILGLARMVWRHHRRLKFQSLHDPLTHLPNRSVFETKLQEAINGARAGNHQVAVILLDLDRFKSINDTLGHAVGDLFLKEVSSRLLRTVRKQDTLARLGGDEFGIIMPLLRDRSEAETAAQRILQVLREPYYVDAFELPGSASIGVSLYPEHAYDPASLQRLADIAMYQCKANSKDEYAVFDAESPNVDFHAARIAELIRESLEKRYFQLHYQPLMNADCGLVGFEALIRLDHPRLGALPPDDFIGIAEHTGLIVRVGHWVLREACRQMTEWHRAGRPDLRINVNVSTVQLMKSDFATTVISVLTETGLPPGALTLEITETQMMRNLHDSLAQIARLRKIGVSVALDDFGTGYSTLGSLSSLEIDYVKIDRLFASRVDHGERHGIAVIEAITTLAHKVGLTVVAEGIETSAQLAGLKGAGCDLFQGYSLGMPVPASQASSMLGSELSPVTHTAAEPPKFDSHHEKYAYPAIPVESASGAD